MYLARLAKATHTALSYHLAHDPVSCSGPHTARLHLKRDLGFLVIYGNIVLPGIVTANTWIPFIFFFLSNKSQARKIYRPDKI